MRPKQHKTMGSSDLFRARLDQIINMKHELVQLAGKLDWAWIDAEIADALALACKAGLNSARTHGPRRAPPVFFPINGQNLNSIIQLF